jgi:SMC interacting uncharacterized protein involved in chromosome segregation
LLATLTWLVELLRYSELARLEVEDFDVEYQSSDQDADSDKQFFLYLRHTYAFFLAGDDAKHKELDDERRGLFMRELAVQREAIETVRCTKTQLQDQLAAQRDHPSDLTRFEQKRRDMQGDRIKFDNVVRKYEEHRDILQKKVHRDESTCRALEKELSEATREKETVQRTLDAQELSLTDAEHMNLERRRLVEDLEQEMDKRDKLTEAINALKSSLELDARSVQDDINVYNQKTRSMRLEKHFKGAKSCVLQLDKSTDDVVAIASDESLDQDKGTINTERSTSALDTSKLMDALRELHEVLHQRLHQIKTHNMELLLRVEKNEAEKALAQSDIQLIEQELQKIEDQFQRTRQDMKKELSARAIETEQLEEEIHSLSVEVRNSLQPMLKRTTQTRLELESSAEKQGMENYEILRRVDEEMEDALHWCINHQEQISMSLENLELGLKERLVTAKGTC